MSDGLHPNSDPWPMVYTLMMMFCSVKTTNQSLKISISTLFELCNFKVKVL